MKITKHIYWRFLRVIGLESKAWNQQHAAGLWCQGERSLHTAKLAMEFCHGGNLIEFGCGDGNLLKILPADAYSSYTGYDIASVAIERAKENAKLYNWSNCTFAVMDMAEWKYTKDANLILLEECAYYLEHNTLKRFVQRCLDSLTPDGCIVVIVHDAKKHVSTVNVCLSVGKLYKKLMIENRCYLILKR
jgi:trans-aconitate methyltransferase